MEEWEIQARKDFGVPSAEPLAPQPLDDWEVQAQQDFAAPAPLQGPPQPRPGPQSFGERFMDNATDTASAHALRGGVRGAANLADSFIGAGQWATGNERTNPLGGMVKEHIDPLFARSDANPKPGNTAAGYVGEFAAPGAVGIKAVNAVANAAQPAVPAAMTRLQSFIQTFRMGGAGPAPLPGAGIAANTGARAGAGAAAGFVGGAATDPGDPRSVGISTVGSSVLGPAGQKAGEWIMDGHNVLSNLLSKDRVPHLRDQIVRDVAGDRRNSILNNLGERGSRIMPGLPVQVMNDPGMSGLDRALVSALPDTYGANTSSFMTDQTGLLAKKLEGRFAGLDQDKATRAAVTGPLFEQLDASTQRIGTGPVRDYVKDTARSKQGSYLLSTLGEVTNPLKGVRGIRPTTTVGRLSNVKHNINKMQEGKWDAATGGRIPLDAAEAKIVNGLKRAIDDTLDQDFNAAALNREANQQYVDLSKPVNRKEALKSVYDKAHKDAMTAGDKEALLPNSLAGRIYELEHQTPHLWQQLEPDDRTFLRQLRKEAPQNASARNYGPGNSAERIASAAIPRAVSSVTRPIPGPLGRGATVAVRAVSGIQSERVAKSLAEIMGNPNGAAELERILLTNPQALSQATGMTPAALARMFAIGAPMVNNER